MKKTRLVLVVTILCSIVVGATSCARDKRAGGEPLESNTPKDALSRLIAGNERFIVQDTRRRNLIVGQSPDAVVLACADSRVSPKILFDEGLGDLFVVRVAGNVSNVDNMASIEYGIENLGSSLIMVVGHESCGAISAALKGVPDEHGDTKNLAALITTIRSNIIRGGGSLEASPDDPTYRSQAIANVRGVIAELMEDSTIISRAVEEGRVALVPAIYGLETGKVEVLGE